MEGVIYRPTERTNFSARPGYAVFGGHLIPRVTLLTGACAAYLHPHLGTIGVTWSERRTRMFLPPRRSVLTISCASIGIILAGTAFQKLGEYDDFHVAPEQILWWIFPLRWS